MVWTVDEFKSIAIEFVALRLTLSFIGFCTLACTIMDINIIRTTTSIYCAREIRRIEMSRCPVASFCPIKICYRLPEKSEFSDILTNRKVSISSPKISDRTLDLIISCLYLRVGVSFQVLFREHHSCIEFVCDLVDFSIDPNLRLELYSRETKINVIFHQKYTCFGCKCLCNLP